MPALRSVSAAIRRSWLMTEWGTSATLGVPGPSVAAGRISDAHFAAECPSYLEQN
jgi:hypothetical protein